jgi:hypothetical protein
MDSKMNTKIINSQNSENDLVFNSSEYKKCTEYVCESCEFICNKKSDWTRHISTLKHRNLLNEIRKNYICKVCNKKYKSRMGLWRHNKVCKLKNDNVEDTISNTPFTKEMFDYLIQENSEFKQLLLKQNDTILDIITKKPDSSITTNYNYNDNKSFNLNVFLNETCKDAMNIDDFVNSIKVSLEDLEHTGKKGYIEGISNIFIKNLNELDYHLRPLHCSDTKREVIYIKSNNTWIKETDNKPLLTNAIKSVAHQNIKQIKAWTEKYPDCIKPTSNKNDTYLKILNESMNGYTNEECVANINKIITNISKETAIKKY